MAAGPRLWAQSRGGELLGLDPDTLAIQEEIDFSKPICGGARSDGSMWLVANQAGQLLISEDPVEVLDLALYRMDLDSGEIDMVEGLDGWDLTCQIGADSQTLVLGAASATLVVDVATLDVVELPYRLCCDPVVRDDAIRLATIPETGTDQVVKIDPDSLDVVATVDFPTDGFGLESPTIFDMFSDDEEVWISVVPGGQPVNGPYTAILHVGT